MKVNIQQKVAGFHYSKVNLVEKNQKRNQPKKIVNLFFICSRNQWRSRTAETIFKNRTGVEIKSAGTSKNARIRISQKLIEWADLIFVMENKHKKRLSDAFPKSVKFKKIIVLDIPDEYQYMEEELIKNLEDSVAFYLDN